MRSKLPVVEEDRRRILRQAVVAGVRLRERGEELFETGGRHPQVEIGVLPRLRAQQRVDCPAAPDACVNLVVGEPAQQRDRVGDPLTGIRRSMPRPVDVRTRVHG